MWRCFWQTDRVWRLIIVRNAAVSGLIAESLIRLSSGQNSCLSVRRPRPWNNVMMIGLINIMTIIIMISMAIMITTGEKVYSVSYLIKNGSGDDEKMQIQSSAKYWE